MTGPFNEPEGATPLGPDDLVGLKFKHVRTRDELNELEQANVSNAQIWLDVRRKSDILTEEFTLKLHRRLFGEVWSWAGEFRKRETNIGIDPLHVPVQLRMLLDDARYWVKNKTYRPLEAGARFHHRMVKIHPFANGNGRHARIAADEFIRDRFAHPPIDWGAGHDLQRSNDRRNAYLRALCTADAGDYAPLLAFVGLEELGN